MLSTTDHASKGLPPRRNSAKPWLPWYLRRRQFARLGAFVLLFTLALLSIAIYRRPGWPAALPSITFEPTPFTIPGPLPHIPPKIWQVYLAFASDAVKEETITSYVTQSPSTQYVILDWQGADALVDHVTAVYPGYKRVRSLYDAMTRTVVRADFLRFLVLALEGGVYTDADTKMVRPLKDWVPDEFKASTKLIVGLEADALDEPKLISGTTYRVQLCQWTMAGAPGHPVFWKMVDRILDKVAERVALHREGFSGKDVLKMGGPAGWTEIIYEHVRQTTGQTMTWENLTGIQEPKLFGDVLILPIDAFATGAPHSGASKMNDYTDQTLVLHSFRGDWKAEG